MRIKLTHGDGVDLAFDLHNAALASVQVDRLRDISLINRNILVVLAVVLRMKSAIQLI